MLANGTYSNDGHWGYLLHPKYASDPQHYIRAFLLIQEDLLKLFEYVEPCDENSDTISLRIQELLTRVCIEIEANFTAILKENTYSNPVTKWVYWCFNYHRPEEFIEAMVGSKEHYLYQHFLDKFNGICKKYGSDAAMNRFFVELDEEWRQKLLEYVENSYF